MQTHSRCQFHVGLFSLFVLLTGTIGQSAQPPGAEPSKKAEPSKIEQPAETKDQKPSAIKLPDGTYLFSGGTAAEERVILTPQEYQALLDRLESLKKELSTRKPVSPSECAIRVRIEKRGEQLVAALKITYTFRTTSPNTAVLLGAKRAFLVAAALDGTKLPVIDTAEEGFVLLVETAGEHSVSLRVEVPVIARGAKSEVGFDLGLPRSPITTLVLEPSAADIKRVNLTTRVPDPAQPLKAPEQRRLTDVDIAQLAEKEGAPGLPLGPVESLDVSWDVPASVVQPADQVHSAVFDIGVVFTEVFVETSAKIKLRGPAREWKLVAAPSSEISVVRADQQSGESGLTQQPIVHRPTESAKTTWTIELPTGSNAKEWVVNVVVRQPRPKTGAKSAGVPVGPFAVLNVIRQTGTIKITAAPHTRFVFKHGPDLRRAEPPGPADDENSVALFRFDTGPTTATAGSAPLLTVEAWPVEGLVLMKPVYKLKLTEAGWYVRAEITVKPIRMEVDAVTIEVPAEWRGLESESDPEIVEGVRQGKGDGFWRPVSVKLATGYKKPFDIVLVATIPVAAGGREATIALPRFPKAIEREACVIATVPEGLELRGAVRVWEGDQLAAWSTPMAIPSSVDGKTPQAATTVTAKGEIGLASVQLNWQPFRPDISSDMTVDVLIGERQVVVTQLIHLRSNDGFARPVRVRGPVEAIGMKGVPALDSTAPGIWSMSPPTGVKEATLKVTYALPAPSQTDGPLTLPIGLFWPLDSSRTQTNARVWITSHLGRYVRAQVAGWRELPPEVVPDRDVLPALTLAASSEQMLMLELAPAAAESVMAFHVDRALIEAAMQTDGSIAYRARYKLLPVLASIVEIKLPEGSSPNPVARVDGVQAPLVPSAGGLRRYRLALPERNASTLLTVELNYSIPGTRDSLGTTVYQPPILNSVVYLRGVRWFITEPGDAVPLVMLSRGGSEFRWRLRGITYSPTTSSRAAMERWFTTGAEPGPGDSSSSADGSPVVLRQAAPVQVSVFRIPWLALVVGSSLVVMLIMIALTWLPRMTSALLLVFVSVCFALGVIFYPQPAAQLTGAAQPGFVLGLAAIGFLGLIRWQHRRRLAEVPAFTRHSTAQSMMLAPSSPTPGVAVPAPSSSTGRSGTSGVPAAAPSGT